MFGVALADEYFADLIEKFHAISKQPLLYPVDDVKDGYRRCVYRSYVIYYRETEDGVEIMAVLGQQDRDQWL